MEFGSQQLEAENWQGQTQVKLASAVPGQQQQASFGLSTGPWTAPPILFWTGSSWILQLRSEAANYFVQIQGGSLRVLSQPPRLTDAEVVPSQEITAGPEPTPTSLPPLTMPGMEMQMNPMRMRLGNMELTMAGATPPPQPVSPHFCSQCGVPVQPGDRFCAQCGHRLRP